MNARHHCCNQSQQCHNFRRFLGRQSQGAALVEAVQQQAARGAVEVRAVDARVHAEQRHISRVQARGRGRVLRGWGRGGSDLERRELDNPCARPTGTPAASSCLLVQVLPFMLAPRLQLAFSLPVWKWLNERFIMVLGSRLSPTKHGQVCKHLWQILFKIL